MSNATARAFAPFIDEERWVTWINDGGRKMPINPWIAGRTPASTTSSSSWSDYAQAKKHCKAYRMSGVGFVFHDGDDVVGVDLDDCRSIRTGEIEPWAMDIVESLGSYSEVSPSGTGLKIWCRCSGLARAYKDNVIGIEIYPRGRYFTVTGQWIEGTPSEIVDATEGLMEVVDSYFSREEEEVTHSDYRQTVIAGAVDSYFGDDELSLDEWVDSALGRIDPDEGYDVWVTVGMALHQGYGGSSAGLGVWDSWSAASKDYNRKEISQKWGSFGGHAGGVTPGTIWRWAEERGWVFDPYEGMDAVEEWGGFSPGAGRASVDDGPVDDGEVDGGPDGSGDVWRRKERVKVNPDDVEKVAPSKLDKVTFLSAGRLYEDRRPYDPYLVHPQVIGTGDIAMLFGPPKTMKTMMAMDMCISWACGRPWMEMEPCRPLRIVYFNAEIKKDNLRRRMHLLGLDGGEVDHIHQNLFFTDRFVATLGKEFVLESLKGLRELGGGFDLVVIDPLIDLFPGESENDNREVKKYMNQLKRFASLIDKDAALFLVHHANKGARDSRKEDPFNSIRGGSAIRGSYDTGMAIDWQDERREVLRMSFECRNGPGVEARRMRWDDQEGRFEAMGGLHESERVAGEQMGTQWDQEALRKAEVICRLLQEEADKGVLYTQAAFSRKFGSVQYGLGSESTLKRKVQELITKKVIGLFDATRYGGPSPYGRSEGHLCCAEMVVPDGCTDLATAQGLVHKVLPDFVFDSGQDQVVPVRGEELLLPMEAHLLV